MHAVLGSCRRRLRGRCVRISERLPPHQFDAAVLRPPVLGFVRCHRCEPAGPERVEPAACDSVFAAQVSDHACRASPAQVQIVCRGTLVVRVANNMQTKRRLTAEQLGNFLQGLLGIGTDGVLIGVKIYSVQCDVSGVRQ